MAGNGRSEPVRVVFINTQYVETDAMSFKSVVQSLTGKDSRAAWMEGSSSVDQKIKTCGSNSGDGGGSGGVPKDLSSVDFEKFLSELPPMEELNFLWAVSPV